MILGGDADRLNVSEVDDGSGVGVVVTELVVTSDVKVVDRNRSLLLHDVSLRVRLHLRYNDEAAEPLAGCNGF